MKKFRITFKKGRTVFTWERFAINIEIAKISAIKAIEDEFYGKALYIGIEEIN